VATSFIYRQFPATVPVGYGGIHKRENSLEWKSVVSQIKSRVIQPGSTNTPMRTMSEIRKLPHREALFQPWFEVAIDTIGPWTIPIDGQNVSFYATTIIDTVTNILTELVLIESRPTAQCSSIAVETGWLMRYPRPVRMIMIKDQSFKERTFAIY
jgi:hypothetical protein